MELYQAVVLIALNLDINFLGLKLIFDRCLDFKAFDIKLSEREGIQKWEMV